MYKHLLKQVCDIQETDQATGDPILVAADVPCTYPFPYINREPSVNTSLDVQKLVIYMSLPDGIEIAENNRIVFDEEEGGNFRIHSISKWPKVKPIYHEVILHGDGNG